MQNHTAMLYSGGLDSFIAYYLLRKGEFKTGLSIDNAKLVYYNIGVDYQEKEHEAIRRQIQFMADMFSGVELHIRYYSRAVLAAYEDPKTKIIPFRNLQFVLWTMQNIASHVILNSTEGDTTHDKDEIFESRVNDLFNHLFADKGKTPKYYKNNRYVGVSMPLVGHTKIEYVRMYLDCGGPPEGLRLTRSCYSVEDTECGKCRSCVRKWIALEANGVVTDGLFKVDPERYARKREFLLKKRGYESDQTRAFLSERSKRKRKK